MPFISDDLEEPDEIHESNFRGWELLLAVIVIVLLLAAAVIFLLPY